MSGKATVELVSPGGEGSPEVRAEELGGAMGVPKKLKRLESGGVWRLVFAWLSLAVMFGAGGANAQGRGGYFNVESPLVHPITVATVDGVDYLLVCNTAANTLEVYSTDEQILSSDRLLDTVFVGLEPITVRVDGTRFYTTNFLGDSITTGTLETVGDDLLVRVERSIAVGDEPMDVAFATIDDQRVLFVTQHSSSSIGWLDAVTLTPFEGELEREQVDLVQSDGVPPLGLKEPRRLEVRDGELFVLGFKGGVTHPDSTYDLDFLISDLDSPTSFVRSISGLGTANFNFRFASNGDLYVVGQEARNMDAETLIDLRDEPTGFVQSVLYRIVAPVGPDATVYRRDLNWVDSEPVPKPEALAMPTDLSLYEVDGIVEKVFVAAFGSDRIGVLEPEVDIDTDPDVGVWARRTIEYASSEPVGGGVRWGPRGMVARTDAAGDRLYVANRLDASVSVFDPVAEAELESFALAEDHTPDRVRRARHFLYSADLSGNGFVSCASCHLDGRTDVMAWRLGNPDQVEPLPAAPDPLEIFSRLDAPAGEGPLGFFLEMIAEATFDPRGPDDKREMVTQSLQGLLNYEVEPGTSDFFTNAPYHWRGDLEGFTDFNETFVTLMLLDDLNAGGEDGPKGVTDEEMALFEEFAHSIQYPPNPQQRSNRELSEGAPGAAVGQEIFYSVPLPAGKGRSCAHCHVLPEGSNNRISMLPVSGEVIPGYVTETTTQPVEVAAIRGHLQKEGLLQRSGFESHDPEVTPRVGHFSMGHVGVNRLFDASNPARSINTFVDAAILPIDVDPDDAVDSTAMRSLKQYVHEYDWGVAPIVGATWTVDIDNVSTPETVELVVLLTEQAELGNASFVVRTLTPGAERGFWYHPAEQTFVEEPTGHRVSLEQIRALVTPEAPQVLLGVPLGSERRIAIPDGIVGRATPKTPSDIRLGPMHSHSGNRRVSTFTFNWLPPDAPPPYTPEPDAAFEFSGVEGAPFAQFLRLMQYGLIEGEGDYGIDAPRHEASVRLRVSGRDIEPGAVLRLAVPDPPPGYDGIPPSEAIEKDDIPTRQLEIPIFPTASLDGDVPIWETAAELEPGIVYSLMLGGPGAPGVQRALDFTICSAFSICGEFGMPDPEPVFEPTIEDPEFDTPFDPDGWNWHFVEVVNPGGEPGVGGWQQLTLRRPIETVRPAVLFAVDLVR